MILRNVAIPRALVSDAARIAAPAAGDCFAGDLLLVDGVVVEVLPHGTLLGSAERDLGGRIVLPRLVEAHCHLDKCHTVARLGAIGGDLHAAITAQQRDKSNWSAADLRRRAERGLAELERAGCAAARTHVDWSMDDVLARQAPVSWTVLGELAGVWADRLTLQRSALLPIDLFADRDHAAWAVQRIAQESDTVLGVFVFNQSQKRAWLANVFELAAAHGLALDFHVDEGLSDGLDGLETMAELAITSRFPLPILCGHACSLANLVGAEQQRVIAQVAAAGMGVVSLPTTNLYLQDRQAGTPQRRGITRLRELAAAGVPLAVGSDNVCDAFCPLGAHDPLAALALAALGAHLDPPYGRWLRLVTTDAWRVLGLPPVYVDQAAAADLLVVDATNTAEVVAGAHRQPLAVWCTGEVDAPATASQQGDTNDVPFRQNHN